MSESEEESYKDDIKLENTLRDQQTIMYKHIESLEQQLQAS